MSGRVLLTVGAVLRGDDACGPLLAKTMEERPVEGWQVFDGGQMPEDYISVIRRIEPDELVMVDAAHMGLPVGELRQLTVRDVAGDFLTTTHSLPLSFMLSELEQCCGEVVFLGVQPGHTDFFAPLSPEVHQTVEQLHAMLAAGTDPASIQFL